MCTATSPQNTTCPPDARVPAETGAADPDGVRLAIEEQLQADGVYPADTQMDNPVVIDAEEEVPRPGKRHKAQPTKVCPSLFGAVGYRAGSMSRCACGIGLPCRREREAYLIVTIRYLQAVL
jgi:hypothetical protein